MLNSVVHLYMTSLIISKTFERKKQTDNKTKEEIVKNIIKSDFSFGIFEIQSLQKEDKQSRIIAATHIRKDAPKFVQNAL